MTTNPGYRSPTVTVATSLPKRPRDAVLLLPVVSTHDDGKPGAVVMSAGPFLDADEVAEIEAALLALDATGGTDQVHRLVVPSLPPVNTAVVGAVAPPAAVAGGAVLLAVGTQAVFRKVVDTVRKAAVLTLFAGAVGALGAHILGLL